MELREYFRLRRRWLVPLVLVPVIAGGVAGALVLREPSTSSARVQLQVPPSDDNSDSAIGLYAARLGQAFSVDSVDKAVAGQVHMSPGDIQTGVAVARIGNSDQLALTFTAPVGPGDATLAAKVAAQEGITYVATQSGDPKQALTVAQRTLAAAQDALIKFQDQVGTLDPNAAYQQAVQSERATGAQLAANQAAGDAAAVNRSQLQINSLRQQEEQLVPVIRQYTPLQQALTAATNQFAQAQNQSFDYQTRVAYAKSGDQIVQSSVSTPRKLRRVIESAAVAAIGGLLVVLGIALLPDLVRRQRGSGARSGTAGRRHRRPEEEEEATSSAAVVVPPARSDTPVGAATPSANGAVLNAPRS